MCMSSGGGGGTPSGYAVDPETGQSVPAAELAMKSRQKKLSLINGGGREFSLLGGDNAGGTGDGSAGAAASGAAASAAASASASADGTGAAGVGAW